MTPSSKPLRLLILGGTTESSRLVAALAGRPEVAPELSLAGRTASPAASPVPTRIGGFGGAAGLARFLADTGVAALVDATHPFAARISAHAAEACTASGVPRLVFTRAPWRPREDDRWVVVADLPAAARALGETPRRVFLTTGRLGLAQFRAAPQHHYLVRTIDPPEPDDLPPHVTLIQGRGPFSADHDATLMRREGAEVLVTKNSGGAAGLGKLEAARALPCPVVMVERPAPPPGLVVDTLEAVLAWIAGQEARAHGARAHGARPRP